MNIIYYVAASLDGFIADTDGSVAWLEQIHIKQDESGYASFFANIDGLLMGRKTYDFVFEHGQWPYGNKPTWVCSSRTIPQMDGCNLQLEHSPETAIDAADSLELKALWVVGGGQIARSLLEARRLTHMSVAVMPILLGSGIALMDALPQHHYLRQTDARQMNGFTQIEYQIDA